MAFGFTKTRYSPIAIDFGADSIKLLQVIPSDPPQLVAAAAAVIPEQARRDTEQRDAFVAEAIKQMLRSQPFKGKQAVCSIPAFQTLVHTFELPRVDGVTIEQQVGDQLLERLQINPARMVIRHVVAGDSLASGSPRQQVICFAVRHDIVMKQIDLARRCKLDIVGMHTEPKALLQAFAHIHGQSKNARSLCFVDIGAATSKVVITHGNKMVFAKTIYAGADVLTSQYAKDNGMAFNEAREARMSHTGQTISAVDEASKPGNVGKMDATAHAAYVQANKMYRSSSMAMSGAGQNIAVQASHGGFEADNHLHGADESTTYVSGDINFESTDDDAVAMNHTRALQPPAHERDVAECLVDELQLSLRYHQRVFPEHPVEGLIFVGGESRNVALCQRIARSVGVAAHLGDPFARVSRVGAASLSGPLATNQPLPGWVVPLGLSMISET